MAVFTRFTAINGWIGERVTEKLSEFCCQKKEELCTTR
jgi:hypothetical protein